MSDNRRLILDANLLISAVLGSRVSWLIRQYRSGVALIAPSDVWDAAKRRLPDIFASRGWAITDLPETLSAVDRLADYVEVIEDEPLQPLQEEAMERIATRDPDDWPIVAAALLIDCPIWTEDRDFFGCGIATWTTDRVEIYLRN